MLDLPLEVKHKIYGYLEFTDLVVLRHVSKSFKVEADSFMATIDHIRILLSGCDETDEESESYTCGCHLPCIAKHMTKWVVLIDWTNLVCCLRFIVKYCPRMAYLDVNTPLIKVPLQILFPLRDTLKYLHIPGMEEEKKIDALSIVQNFPALVDLDIDIDRSCICLTELHRLYSQKHPGQFLSYSNVCQHDDVNEDRHHNSVYSGCLLEKITEPVARLRIKLPEKEAVGQLREIIPNALTSIQVLEIIVLEIMELEDYWMEDEEHVIAKLLKNHHLPNLRVLKLVSNDVFFLEDLMTTLSQCHSLETLHLPSSGREIDDRLLRSLLDLLPELKFLEYSFARRGLVAREIDYEAHCPLPVPPQLIKLKLVSTLPIVLQNSSSDKLRTLMLHGPLHDEFTINFTNLTTFQFNGPIREQQLTQAVGSLVHSTHLRTVRIRQDRSIQQDAHPHQELGRQIAHLLSTNRKIDTFDVQLVFAQAEAEEFIVDLSGANSLSDLEWNVKKLSFKFILPGDLASIIIEGAHQLMAGGIQFRFNPDSSLFPYGRWFNVRSMDSSFALTSQESMECLSINLWTSGLFEEMCSVVSDLFTRIDKVIFFGVAHESLFKFQLLLNYLLDKIQVPYLHIEAGFQGRDNWSIRDLLAPVYWRPNLAIEIFIDGRSNSESFTASQDHLFVTNLANQSVISDFKYLSYDGIYKLGPDNRITFHPDT